MLLLGRVVFLALSVVVGQQLNVVWTTNNREPVVLSNAVNLVELELRMDSVDDGSMIDLYIQYCARDGTSFPGFTTTSDSSSGPLPFELKSCDWIPPNLKQQLIDDIQSLMYRMARPITILLNEVSDPVVFIATREWTIHEQTITVVDPREKFYLTENEVFRIRQQMGEPKTTRVSERLFLRSDPDFEYVQENEMFVWIKWGMLLKQKRLRPFVLRNELIQWLLLKPVGESILPSTTSLSNNLRLESRVRPFHMTDDPSDAEDESTVKKPRFCPTCFG